MADKNALILITGILNQTLRQHMFNCIPPILFTIFFLCITFKAQAQTDSAARSARKDSIIMDYRDMDWGDIEYHDEEPVFDDFQGYVKKNLKYPRKARWKGIAGKVTAEFVIEKDGTLTNARIIKSLSPECDAEVVRFLETMPPWTPGRTNGEPVKVKYSVTFTFGLK